MYVCVAKCLFVLVRRIVSVMRIADWMGLDSGGGSSSSFVRMQNLVPRRHCKAFFLFLVYKVGGRLTACNYFPDIVKESDGGSYTSVTSFSESHAYTHTYTYT